MISDAEARRIASLWCNDHAPALQAFWSTGAINTARADHDIHIEIYDCNFNDSPPMENKDLHALDDYCLANEPRAAVAGWSALPLDPRPQEHPR